MGSRLALTWALSSILAGGAVAAECRDDTVWLRGDFGQARFSVEIADDPQERARGLMFVERMPASSGMLFVFQDEAPRSFWMRNTLIPLDIIYADARGRIVRVHPEAIPGDETPIPSGGAAQYVLEINGGMAARLGIAAGAELRHPAIADAAWPCD